MVTPRNPPATATATPTATAAARGEIAGRIAYYGSDIPVADATIALGATQGSTTSATDGGYRLLGLPIGAHELALTKEDDQRGAIDAIDAVRVLEALNHRRALDPIEETACNVDGNRRLDRRDAEQILDVVIGARDRFEVAALCNSDWLFFPSPERSLRSPPALTATRHICPARAATVDTPPGATRQDFDAILLGNCSGAWKEEAGTAAPVGVDTTRVTVAAPMRSRGGRLRVPIVIDMDASDAAAEIRLTFDARNLNPVRVRSHPRRPRLVVRFHANDAGTLTIALARAMPPSQSEPLMLLLDLAPRDRTVAPAGPPLVTSVRMLGG